MLPPSQSRSVSILFFFKLTLHESNVQYSINSFLLSSLTFLLLCLTVCFIQKIKIIMYLVMIYFITK
jgi:hypothetical protein